MLARAITFAIDGLHPRRVAVEVDVRPGLPAFTVVGLADPSVQEARQRVRAALVNSGFEFPGRRIVANLAPASLRKAGPGFDLALAVALLAATQQVPAEPLARHALLGELSLGGQVRPVAGTLAVAEGARRAGLEALVLARERASEAALVEGLTVAAVPTLRDAVDVLAGRRPAEAPDPVPEDPPARDGPDLGDVRGHVQAVRALVIAAAGGHNVLLQGPPGTGKTMLARRLPGILPPLSRQEALEVTRVHSVAGLHHSGGLVAERPFRAPHHTISAAGLVGGGSVPTAGEATLAHHGVLFLDELSEFSRSSLEALRQPLEDGVVSIVRGQRALLFPARFMLAAATNPCPCGFAGAEDGRCRCTESELARHRRRLSGPLLDRIDLLVPVGRPSAQALAGPATTTTAAARAQVLEARARQGRRLAGTAARCNSHMDSRVLRREARLTPEAAAALEAGYRRSRLSARGHQRVLRVARTIADLAGRDRVERDDVLGALTFRQEEDAVDGPGAVAA